MPALAWPAACRKGNRLCVHRCECCSGLLFSASPKQTIHYWPGDWTLRELPCRRDFQQLLPGRRLKIVALSHFPDPLSHLVSHVVLLHHHKLWKRMAWPGCCLGYRTGAQCSGLYSCQVIREHCQWWQQPCTAAVHLTLLPEAHPGMQEPWVHPRWQFSQALTLKSVSKLK